MTHADNHDRVPVIILNWNGWNDTFACLRSLASAPDVTEVWLVDNGSEEKRIEEARALWPGLRVVQLHRNFGFSGGMNRAMQTAAAEGHSFTYLLNNDCTVVPGFLRHAIDAARDPDVAIVGSRIGDLMTPNFLLFDGRYYKTGERPIDAASSVRRVSEVDGAGMLIRLRAVERDGYFDERFFCYHEEVELCRRLRSRGWSCAVADASLVLHKQAGSDIDGNEVYYRNRNYFLLARLLHGVARGPLKIDALYYLALAGEGALLNKRRDKLRVLAAALSDGLRGSFGERRSMSNSIIGLVMLRVLVILVRALRWLKTSFIGRSEAIDARNDPADRTGTSGAPEKMPVPPSFRDRRLAKK
jgi:GT2 family glycosyltransferase